MDQDRIAGFQSAQVHHRFMGGDEDFGDGGGLHIIQLRWNRHRHAVVDTGQFGIGAAAHDPHHPITDRIADDVAAGLDDFPSNFKADDRRVAKVRAPVATFAVGQVGAIDACRVDAYQQVARTHFRSRYVGQFQYIGVAEGFEGDRFHDGFSSGLADEFVGEVVFDPFDATFRSVTAFLQAAERQLGGDDAVLVDANHSGLQPVGDVDGSAMAVRASRVKA